MSQPLRDTVSPERITEVDGSVLETFALPTDEASLEAMLRECKFTVRSQTLHGNRAVLNCRAVEDPELDYLHAIARGLRPKA